MKLIATNQMTLVNVNDGAPSYTHTAYTNITKLCNENGSFTLQDKSTVRYGIKDKWVYKTLNPGTYTASNSFFGGDPYSGLGKECHLISSFSLTDSTGRNWLGTYSDNNVNAVANPSYFTWQFTKGDKGDKGATGATGAQGPKGDKGATGATGPQGPKGDKGATGDRGPQGIQGIQGPKGDQGIQGPKGADGKTQYTHIAYADNATGGGFSQTDHSKAYIGMYVDFNATDSTDPTKYRWSKWHGDKGATGAQGIQGPKGADGRTPYLHIAYANSADGRTGFSTSNTDNKRYLGTYTDYTQADSTDPSKYKWVDMVGTVKVGGRNLLVKTNQGTTNWDWSLANGDHSAEEIEVDGVRAVKLIKGTKTANTSWNFIQYKGLLRKLIQPNTQYVLSFDVMPSVNVSFIAMLMRGDAQAMLTDSVRMNQALANQWTRVSCVLTSKVTLSDDLSQVVYLQGMSTANGNWLIIKNIKLEEGNVPTPWSPALEDVQSDIDSKADQALTQQQLEALEAKRQQMIVEIEAKATIEQISELQGYLNKVKQDDEEGRQKIAAIATAIEERVRNIEPILTYSQKMQFIDTYITQGNGGMIIGANDSTTKVVVTPNRISFQDGGSEVAYISQSVLHIDNGVFTLSLQLGHFITRAHPKNQYVNATYFVK
ncbi:Collagen triple helix repeat-containing protein [Streptococcus equinus]|uniref:Collagen triple helix repeat-containing protein n=1 Tax=Streptococcus equinus TaxID=1335 RepID=A0A239RD41_STREI|nr:hypothetical protein [Streptococcus equinus]SNU08722.1 Collagen triple helix repeat-containing protein [Streptococcus equinus]